MSDAHLGLSPQTRQAVELCFGAGADAQCCAMRLGMIPLVPAKHIVKARIFSHGVLQHIPICCMQEAPRWTQAPSRFQKTTAMKRAHVRRILKTMQGCAHPESLLVQPMARMTGCTSPKYQSAVRGKASGAEVLAADCCLDPPDKISCLKGHIDITCSPTACLKFLPQ